MSCSAQSHDGNIIRITSKRSNVLLNPLKRNIHILQSNVQQTFVGSQLGVQSTEYTNAILHANSNIRLFRESKHGVRIMHPRSTAIECSSRNENSNRKFSITWCMALLTPDVDGEAIL